MPNEKKERVDEKVLQMIDYMETKYRTHLKDIAYLALKKALDLAGKLDPDGSQGEVKKVFDELMKQAEESGKNLQKRSTESSLKESM